MLFNSYEFLFAFLPIALSVFFLLRHNNHHSFAILWLIIASLFFYGWWETRYLFLIGFSVIFNFATGRWLIFVRERAVKTTATIILWIGVTVNLSLIGYFKYANFFIDNISKLSGADWHLTQIILPIGISFFTFQQIAYLVDARKGITQEHNFLQYCLFVVFFPQLIAGPIVHHKQVLPQFSADSLSGQPIIKNLAIGTTIFAVGIFKKVFIADNLALIATPLFDVAGQGQVLDFFQAWQGTIAYTLQLYFDFSGYSDMAIGIARMFGIRLPLNFHSPYQAVNIIEFWQRWHMTLSQFLRDYVYIPLGGNRRGTLRRYANLVVTMLLGGFWHGASWTFIFWGSLHALFLISNHVWHFMWRVPIDRWWSRLIARSLTFFAVALAWVFFRAENIETAVSILDGMRNLPITLSGRIGPLEDVLAFIGFRFAGPWITTGDIYSLFWLVFWLSLLWLLPNTQQWMAKIEPAIDYPSKLHLKNEKSRLFDKYGPHYWTLSGKWAVYTGILLTLALLSMSKVSEFLYFQF